MLDGLFLFYDTFGVPFEVIFDECRAAQVMPSWRHLYRDARQAGWSHQRILARLWESLGDVYGGEFRDIVIRRLQEQFSET